MVVFGPKGNANNLPWVWQCPYNQHHYLCINELSQLKWMEEQQQKHLESCCGQNPSMQASITSDPGKFPRSKDKDKVAEESRIDDLPQPPGFSEGDVVRGFGKKGIVIRTERGSLQIKASNDRIYSTVGWSRMRTCETRIELTDESGRSVYLFCIQEQGHENEGKDHQILVPKDVLDSLIGDHQLVIPNPRLMSCPQKTKMNRCFSNESKSISWLNLQILPN